MNVYSNAFNFNSYLSGSVDPRTGQYTSQIKLATLSPQGPLEVSRDVMLFFSMLSVNDSSYGKGWHLSSTEFDVRLSRLSLMSGEQYQAQRLPAVGGTMLFTSRKLKDLVVKRPDAETLHVIYKDGTLEILKSYNTGDPYRINAIQFENGERFTFRYALGKNLDRIFDHNGNELLILAYSGNNLSMVDTRVDGGRYARVRFTYSNDRLQSVTAPYDRSDPPGSVGYTFTYIVFRNGLGAISKVQSPMGGEEQITYAENGHAYSNSQYIPRVVRWEQIPTGNQPMMVHTYDYSPGTNFTGYPFAGGFSDGEDNLYRVPGDYIYWADEISVDAANKDAVLSVTRTTYNKFHLLTEERVQREGTRTTKTLAYNTVPGLFPEQPLNFQLPKLITTRYDLVAGGAAREVKVAIQTDDYGNELSRTEASGVRVDYSYYPPTGEAGKCPADPQGLFVRFVKSERLIPAGGTPAARLTEYTHTRIPSSGASYVVLQQSSTQAGVFKLEQAYYETPVTLAGRLKSTTSTIDGQKLVSDFSYTINGDTLSETRRLNGREGQWLESVRTLSLVNRRLLSMMRDGGSTLALAFDVSGRLTSETVSPGKPQKAVRSYAYHFATQAKRAHLITTDAQDKQSITYYDGLGRQVSEVQKISEKEERVSRTWLYDALGQIQETVDNDYLGDGQRLLKSTYSYSRWGNSSRVTRADGSVVIDEYDPQLNIKLEGIEGGERIQTYFNEHNQPVKVERIDTANNRVEVESRTYDGLGRCLSVLDVSKNRTEFTYDLYDRQLTATQKPVDGTPQRSRKTDYAPGTSGEMVSALSIDGKRLGARDYDSLGRMTSQARGTGQATISWEYKAGSIEPNFMDVPGGRQTLTHDKELDVLTKVEMAGLPDIHYRHDPVTGALTGSETNGLDHEVSHDEFGHPEKDVQTAANGTKLTALYNYSPGGRLQEQTAADGQKSQFVYDTRGRFSKMTTGAMVIEQGYDTFGRPQTLTTTYDSLKVVTKVSYDTLGREAERRFEQNGALLQVMTSTYYANSMLATRILKDASSRVVIGETFTYDAYLRLKTYRCEGLEHPKDHLGRGLVEQDFSFDNLNNITKVVSTFADGTQDTCMRYFTGTDPTQLTRVTHTRPVQDFTLTYDAAGNVKTAPSGQVYTYNGFDQLTAVQVGALKYSYQYDAESRQVSASRGSETPVMLAYSGDRLDVLVEGSKKIRYFDGGDQVMARSGGVDGPQLHVNDAAGSVRGVSAPGQAHVRRHYTPYGDTQIPLDDGKARTMADLQLPAFNGQRLDVASNLYFLGNGLRVYDPGLMVFLQADPLSPFDEGGINGYAYCACNPINMLDPNGMWPGWLKWALTGVALALSVVTLGFGAAGLAAAVGMYMVPTVAAGIGATIAASTAVAVPAAAGVLAGTAVAAAAAAATATAATAAWVIASKTALTVGAGLGVVGGTLSVTGLAIAEVDKAMGWDRSHHINKLGWASLGFSIASLVVSVAGAYTSAHMAYRAAVDTPIGSGLSAAGQRMVGLTYKFTDKGGVTKVSRIFGGTRAVLRFINFGRSIEARSKATPKPEPERVGTSALPQPQPSGSHLTDMPSSSAGYYQAFRDEAMRVRQPILGELFG